MIKTYIPNLKNNEKKELYDCIRTGFVSTAGSKVNKFEKIFSNKFKFNYSIAVNSGTSALHLSLLSTGIKNNDLVIVPSYTFAATVNAIIYCGAEPWFFDSNDDLTLDIDKLEKILEINTRISSNKLYHRKSGKIIRAIVPVQTLGKKINFDGFEKLAKKFSLKVIFDSAASHDQNIFQFKKKNNSVFCFSFNGNKTLTTGAGGMVATNSKKLAKKIRIYSTVGKKSGNYDYELIGYNYKMTNIQAAMGIAQIKNLKKILEKKKRIFQFYEKNLNYEENYEKIFDKSNINWVFALKLKNQIHFKKIKKIFNKKKIQFDLFWKPLHLQIPYKNYKKENLNNCNKFWPKIAVLPSHPGIKLIDQIKICKVINNFFR